MKSTRDHRMFRGVLLLMLAAVLSGCGSATPELPRPRTIVIHSGARLRADYERMKEVNEWVTREQANIAEDPSFLVVAVSVAEEVYPWEGMAIRGDTVWVRYDARAPDTRLVHEIYGHLHLMARMGRQAEWLPEAPDATGYALERAILKRVSDAWLLGAHGLRHPAVRAAGRADVRHRERVPGRVHLHRSTR